MKRYIRLLTEDVLPFKKVRQEGQLFEYVEIFENPDKSELRALTSPSRDEISQYINVNEMGRNISDKVEFRCGLNDSNYTFYAWSPYLVHETVKRLLKIEFIHFHWFKLHSRCMFTGSSHFEYMSDLYKKDKKKFGLISKTIKKYCPMVDYILLYENQKARYIHVKTLKEFEGPIGELP